MTAIRAIGRRLAVGRTVVWQQSWIQWDEAHVDASATAWDATFLAPPDVSRQISLEQTVNRSCIAHTVSTIMTSHRTFKCGTCKPSWRSPRTPTLPPLHLCERTTGSQCRSNSSYIAATRRDHRGARECMLPAGRKRQRGEVKNSHCGARHSLAPALAQTTSTCKKMPPSAWCNCPQLHHLSQAMPVARHGDQPMITTVFYT